MDPNISAEQPGLTSDPGETDNSVNYLRRLKAQTEADTSSGAAARAGTQAQVQDDPSSGKNRRRSPRYHCAGSAELTQEGSHVRMWGTLTDISLRGCYVEMSTTFPADTKIDLVLDAVGIRFRARGIVRISYPFLGMGILLTEIAPEQGALLDQLLATLAQATTVANPLTVREKSAADMIAAAEPMMLLKELGRFFDRKAILSREEFSQIAERCRRT